MFSINGAFLSQQITGVQRYAAEITREIFNKNAATTLSDNEAAERPRLIIRGDNRDSAISNKYECVKTANIPGPVWNQCVLPIHSRGMLFSFGNIGPVSYYNQTLCVHDANVYIVPESYSLNYRLYQKFMLTVLSRSVRHITTVSKFSRDMLWKHIASRDKEIFIMPNGREHVYGWDKELSTLGSQSIIDQPFVLLIGSKAKHKNIDILESIAPELAGIGLNILMAGKSSVHFSRAKHETYRNVIELGYVSDNDLALLYSKAVCLVFPSITEGFGIPPLEAMTLSCPVVSSNVASMPEVCGSAVLYASPHNPAEWVSNVKKIYKSSSLRSDLIEAGLSRSKLFSWGNSAESYLSLV